MNKDSQDNRRPSVQNDDIISLSEIIGIVLTGKWWIAGITVAFAVFALGYLWVATPEYRADALVQVESQKSPLGSLVDIEGAFGGESSSETEVEVIRSRFVLGKVVLSRQLNVRAEPDYFPVFGRAIARRFRPDIETNETLNSPFPGLGGYAWGGEKIRIERFEVPATREGQPYVLVAGERGAYRLERGDGISVFEGRVGEPAVSGDEQTRLFLSKLEARAGTRFNLVRQPMIIAIQQLSSRLSVSERGRKTGVLTLALTGANSNENKRVLEAVAQRYLRQNVERVSAEAQNSLVFLEEQLPVVKDKLELAENRLNHYRLENQTVDLTLETQAVLDQAVKIDTELAQIDIQLQQMGMRYTASHPVMQELQSRRNFMQKRKEKFLTETEGLPETQQDVMRLARDVEVSTQVYTELLSKAQELNIVKASAVGNVRILDHAMSAILPIKPKKALIAVLATLLGGMLGCGVVFVREMLSQGVKTPEEIEAKTGLSVYASVLQSEQQVLLENNARKQGGSFLLAQAAPGDLAIESLRSLRTNLVFALMEAKDNRIMITGPSPGVGKSFVSANLAVLLAEVGQKVLVIDADLRKGHLHKLYGFKKGVGLAECIVGKASVEETVHKVSDTLHVLATGHYPPNPSELLMTPAYRTLLEQASEQYDVVLIDTPPILAVTDAAIVGKQCGTTFMVVRAEVNPVREVDYAANRLQQSGINVSGCVLNCVTRKSARYGSYGYYQYSYS